MAHRRVHQFGQVGRSRVIDKSDFNRHYDNHKRRIREIKCSIDNKPPQRFKHLSRNSKAIQRLKEYHKVVGKENRRLLNRMKQITNRKGRFSEINSRTLWYYKLRVRNRKMERKTRYDAIEKENNILGKRLGKLPSYYNNGKWEDEWRKHQKIMKHMCSLPYVLTKGTKDEKSGKMNNGNKGEKERKKEPTVDNEMKKKIDENIEKDNVKINEEKKKKHDNVKIKNKEKKKKERKKKGKKKGKEKKKKKEEDVNKKEEKKKKKEKKKKEEKIIEKVETKEIETTKDAILDKKNEKKKQIVEEKKDTPKKDSKPDTLEDEMPDFLGDDDFLDDDDDDKEKKKEGTGMFPKIKSGEAKERKDDNLLLDEVDFPDL